MISAADRKQLTPNEINKQFRDEFHENEICRDVGHILAKNYPGWRWWVECRLPTGMFTIVNLDLHSEYGFGMYLAHYLANPARHTIIMRAGGEILERFGMPLGAKPEQLESERVISGNAEGDHS